MISTDITLSVESGSSVVPDWIPADYLRIAHFAASLSQRLLAETKTDGSGADDEFLRGYARAASDLADALLAGDLACGGPYCTGLDA